jgi:hypothetical protein
VKGDTGEVTALDELSFSGLPTSQIIQKARVIAVDSQTEQDETIEVGQGAFSNQIDLKHPRKQRHRETA